MKVSCKECDNECDNDQLFACNKGSNGKECVDDQ